MLNKNYRDYNFRYSDLPTANYSSEPLSDSWVAGLDEEGLMAEIGFNPNFNTEIIFNYAEGWSSDKDVRQADFYSEFRREFSDFIFKAEYSHLEQKNAKISLWNKEITPALSMEFTVKEIPILLKLEHQLKSKDNISGIQTHYEPKIQTDVSYKDYSISITVEHEYTNAEDFLKDNFWIGTELAITMFQNTDIRFFAGKEKGGKVCRNGSCRYQSEFEGIRLEITTTF
jgi:hypothetical protein